MGQSRYCQPPTTRPSRSVASFRGRYDILGQRRQCPRLPSGGGGRREYIRECQKHFLTAHLQMCECRRRFRSFMCMWLILSVNRCKHGIIISARAQYIFLPFDLCEGVFPPPFSPLPHFSPFKAYSKSFSPVGPMINATGKINHAGGIRDGGNIGRGKEF